MAEIFHGVNTTVCLRGSTNCLSRTRLRRQSALLSFVTIPAHLQFSGHPLISCLGVWTWRVRSTWASYSFRGTKIARDRACEDQSRSSILIQPKISGSSRISFVGLRTLPAHATRGRGIVGVVVCRVWGTVWLTTHEVRAVRLQIQSRFFRQTVYAILVGSAPRRLHGKYYRDHHKNLDHEFQMTALVPVSSSLRNGAVRAPRTIVTWAVRSRSVSTLPRRVETAVRLQSPALALRPPQQFRCAPFGLLCWTADVGSARNMDCGFVNSWNVYVGKRSEDS